MRYLKMTLPAIVLIIVLVVAIRIYPDMAKSYQEKENAAAEAQLNEEENAAEGTQPEKEDTDPAAEVPEISSVSELADSEDDKAEAELTGEESASAGGSEDSGKTEEDPAAAESASANTAPDFEIKDAYGIDGKLSDHFGKPIVVNFWATWCPFCVQELPLFDKYSGEYSEEIDFIIVDLADGYRETIELAKKYMAENGYSFPAYFDTTGGSMYAYGITGIPVTLFIDGSGNLVTQHVGAIDEDTLVRNMRTLGADIK